MNGSQHLEPRPADHDFFKLKTSFLFIQLTSCGSAVAPDLQRFEASCTDCVWPFFGCSHWALNVRSVRRWKQWVMQAPRSFTVPEQRAEDDAEQGGQGGVFSLCDNSRSKATAFRFWLSFCPSTMNSDYIILSCLFASKHAHICRLQLQLLYDGLSAWRKPWTGSAGGDAAAWLIQKLERGTTHVIMLWCLWWEDAHTIWQAIMSSAVSHVKCQSPPSSRLAPLSTFFWIVRYLFLVWGQRSWRFARLCSKPWSCEQPKTELVVWLPPIAMFCDCQVKYFKNSNVSGCRDVVTVAFPGGIWTSLTPSAAKLWLQASLRSSWIEAFTRHNTVPRNGNTPSQL